VRFRSSSSARNANCSGASSRAHKMQRKITERSFGTQIWNYLLQSHHCATFVDSIFIERGTFFFFARLLRLRRVSELYNRKPSLYSGLVTVEPDVAAIPANEHHAHEWPFRMRKLRQKLHKFLILRSFEAHCQDGETHTNLYEDFRPRGVTSKALTTGIDEVVYRVPHHRPSTAGQT